MIMTGMKASMDMVMRKQATWTGEKAIRLFLMRIKELPQTILRKMKINQF
jgi:hypothetical protein